VDDRLAVGKAINQDIEETAQSRTQAEKQGERETDQ